MTRRRILFVDDNPNILAGIRRLLLSLRDDFELSFAENGKEALESCPYPGRGHWFSSLSGRLSRRCIFSPPALAVHVANALYHENKSAEGIDAQTGLDLGYLEKIRFGKRIEVWREETQEKKVPHPHPMYDRNTIEGGQGIFLLWIREKVIQDHCFSNSMSQGRDPGAFAFTPAVSLAAGTYCLTKST